MKNMLLLVPAASVLVAGCGDKQAPGNAQQTNTAEGGSLITAPVDYLGALAKGQQSAVSSLDTSSITHAIQLFQVDHGRFPTNLDELVKGKYLGQMPQAPYGYKIDYDAQTGDVKVVKQ